MKILKNIFLGILLLVSFGYLGYSIHLYFAKPCDSPLEYSIGTFDTRFGVSEDIFKRDLTEAGAVWEKVLGRKVFIYKPDAPFKINLIYDERQVDTNQKQKTESGLSQVEAVLNGLDAEFSRMKSAYESKIASHETSIQNFKENQKDYESKVAYWNTRGGAPKEEYQSLQDEARALNIEANNLNQETVELNTLAKELNVLLEKRNEAARNYNAVAKNYNQKYGHGLEFNQAEYTGKMINVYQFGNSRDLMVALAHEFGHALGMEHVENSKSIMYYMTGTNSESDLTLSTEDIAELRRVCKF